MVAETFSSLYNIVMVNMFLAYKWNKGHTVAAIRIGRYIPLSLIAAQITRWKPGTGLNYGHTRYLSQRGEFDKQDMPLGIYSDRCSYVSPKEQELGGR
jgi:hypothetical protein